jgi:hypothetical protein
MSAVVAVPAAVVVERDHEQVGAVQRRERGPAVALLGDGVTQRAAQPIQYGRLGQEPAEGLALSFQHLVDEVVHDVPVVAREARDERGAVVATLVGFGPGRP